MQIAFILPFLFSCAKPCSDWIYEDSITANLCFNSAKIFYPVQNTFSGLELVMIHDSEGVRAEAHLYSFEITQRQIDVSLNNGVETLDSVAEVFKGGQKLLLGSEVRDFIIQSLLCGNVVEVQIGRYQTSLLPSNFDESYRKLMDAPITL